MYGKPLVHALVLALASATLASVGPAAAREDPGQAYAGAARVDSTWHVGASAGQYASQGTFAEQERIDPYHHVTRRGISDGIQGREWVRALVVQGADGTRYAVVTNDLYIPQDLVNRRVAGILAEHDAANPDAATGITPENLTISVSHSHSSPYYSTPSWGVWAFQDVFDIRYFEHIARRMAEAVIRASSDMVPVRMGAATYPFTIDGTEHGRAWIKKHSYGPAQADDGTPAGYPRWDTDRDLSVVRFDDVSGSTPRPLATWVIWGLHPEDLEGNDLLASEYVNDVETILDRELGGISLFSQNDTGTAESVDSSPGQVITRTEPLPPHLRQEFSHRDYAQAQRAARILADGVKTAWADVATGSSGGDLAPNHRVVPFSTDFPVGVVDRRFAPPGYRLLPSVSSCRTENAFDGNPGVPIAGLPDCEYVFGQNDEPADSVPVNTSVTYEMLRDLCHDGVVAACVPDNTPGPSYTGLQETLQVHLQAIRLGNVAITVCPCEQWADQSRNIKTRLDTTAGNLWYGWDWTANYTDPGWEPGVIYDGATGEDGELLPGHGPVTLNDWCIPAEGGGWSCKTPGDPRNRLDITDEQFRRMKAQIYNDAAGWDALESSFQAETEPTDVEQIWGNFTHEELDEFGYDMVLTVGMSNDYWGYIASYREFQRGDHYRKALTGLGPHSMDFLATRLSRMAASMNGGPPVELGPKDLAYTWDYQHQGGRQEVIGRTARTALPAYEAQMPADGGAPGIVEQPSDVRRFDAARFAWIGGSNWTDTPHARVERCVRAGCDPEDPEAWAPYADGFLGGVQVEASYPAPGDMPAWRAGQFEWRWEATFEAFDSEIALPDASGTSRDQTPAGVYRFTVDGCHRGAPGTPTASLPDPACDSWDPLGRVRPYHLVSEPFRVGPWDGITVEDIRLHGDNTVSVAVGPDFPYPHRTSNTDELFDDRFGSYEATSAAVDHPDTYESPFDFIRPRQDLTGGSENDENDDVLTYDPEDPTDDEVFCFDCSFRPWTDTGAVRRVIVTMDTARGRTVELVARYDPDSGRYRTKRRVRPGATAYVDRGGATDTFGEYNGQASGSVTRPG